MGNRMNERMEVYRHPADSRCVYLNGKCSRNSEMGYFISCSTVGGIHWSKEYCVSSCYDASSNRSFVAERIFLVPTSAPQLEKPRCGMTLKMNMTNESERKHTHTHTHTHIYWSPITPLKCIEYPKRHHLAVHISGNMEFLNNEFTQTENYCV